MWVLVSKVRVLSTTGVTSVSSQYRELQASSQLCGDSMKETKVQMSRLQQAIQSLRSQTEALKKQVRVPELPEPCLFLPLCQGHCWVGVNLDNWLDFKWYGVEKTSSPV